MLREHLAVSQSEMSRVAGVTRQTWIAWEQGRSPDHRTLSDALTEIGTRWSIDVHGYVRTGEIRPVAHLEPLVGDRRLMVPTEFEGECRRAHLMQGDSMIDLIYPGDTVIVDLSVVPRVGDVVAATHRALGDVLIRQMYPTALHALNPRFADIDIEEFAILGTVVGIDRRANEEHTFRHNPKGLRPQV